jgi:hypothetical protein
VRRGLIVTLLVVALGVSLAPSAAAEALYRGKGPGIRVEFRVKDGEISFARVRTVLRCVRDRRRVRRLYGDALGTTTIRNGRFRIAFETEEPGYGQEMLLVGAVHPTEITGRFWYQHFYQRRSVCQTRNYQTLPIRHIGRDSLRFWASRRPVTESVRR